MAQDVTHSGQVVSVLSGKQSAIKPPLLASGAATHSVYPSAAPDGFIGWNPGPDVARSNAAAVAQPTNSATL